MLQNLEQKQFIFKMNTIPYYELYKSINNEIFRKYFIIDIRKISDDILSIIFNYFDKFNRQLLEDEFFTSNSKNMMVLFLYSKDRNYDINMQRIMYDMEFALKKFVTEEGLYDIISKSSIELNCVNKTYFSSDNISFSQGFNLLYGLNSSGKTTLINGLSDYSNMPVFNMGSYGLNLTSEIEDVSLIEKYLTKLNEFDRYGKNTNIMNYFNRLSQILAFCEEKKSMVLLDDLCWGMLDDRNKINIIDTLFDYLCSNGSSVVVTSCQSDIKGLVKSRVYKPNIIEVVRNK